MFENRTFWYSLAKKAYYADGDGDDGDAAGPTDGGDSGMDGINGDSFTQEQMNAILAKEKRKYQSNIGKVMQELDTLKTKASMTTEEREELESRLEDLQKSLKTKEELANDKLKQQEKKFSDQLEALTGERDSWRDRFTDSTIARSIVDAAAENNAYSPDQILAILRPKTRLTEALDDEGKPTGEMTPKVTFEDIKDDKKIELELTPSEAVKKMRDMDRFLNLFKGEGSGGLGLQNRSGGKDVDLREVARDPAKYAELRKAGKIKF